MVILDLTSTTKIGPMLGVILPQTFSRVLSAITLRFDASKEEKLEVFAIF